MSRVRLRLLGPFAVTGEDAPEPVRGSIPQAVVARLAIAQAPMTSEALVRDLWATPTDAVVSSLRAHVSRLRARGWDALLQGGRDGYRLVIDPDDVDALRLERLVAGDAAEGRARVDVLAEAEALWRGEPLPWAGSFPFAEAAVGRVRSLRRSGALELATLRLDAGDAARALAALASLDDDVIDAEASALRATSLARSGRTSEAVAIVDAHVAASEAAGVEPVGALLDLRGAIVRQDPVTLGTDDAGAEATIERVGIPHPLTRFVGRERELDAVRRGRADSRLVTLIGAAGVGKTRLAIEAARRAGPGEDEVQWMVDLATIADPAEVLASVAVVVGASSPTVDAVAHMMGGRRGLLVVDNAEHVLGAVASTCAALLERCAGLSILVTSREAMRMAGERVVTVPPLLGSQADEAVELFLQRARDSSGVVVWDEGQRRSVRALCARLDGLPLAIELAASRLDVLTLGELAESLEQPDGHDGAGRHESIASAIEWSVRLTSETERRLLAQLAELAGTFTLEMVAGICEVGDADPREVVVALARKSLVSAVEGVGQRRFRVLEAVRRHLRRTRPIPDRAAWRRGHARWLAAHAEQLAPGLRTHDAIVTRAALLAAKPDLDAAVAWSLDEGDREVALRLVAALAWHWYERGSGGVALERIDRALALPGESDPDAECHALRAACFIAAIGRDGAETVRYAHRLSRTAAHAQDPVHPMLAAVMRAYLAAQMEDEEEADAALADAERWRDVVGDTAPWAVADALMIRGDALRALGRPSQALAVLGDAYRLAAGIGHAWAVRGACYVTGKTLVAVRRPADALPILRTGAVTSMQHEDVPSALAAVNVFAIALAHLDRAERSAELFGAVDALGLRHGYDPRGSDAAITDDARRRVRQILTPEAWEAALASGGERDLRWVLSHLDPTP